MTLLDIQRRMARAVMQPGPASDAAFIKPGALLSSSERLEIYRESYRTRVLDSLGADFPGLRAMLGERAFRTLAEAYLTECPSRSFTLRNLGSRLEDWLRRNPAYAAPCPAPAHDMTRLEWAHIEAFDGAEQRPLGPEDLLEPNEDMTIGLQPCISLLALDYPVDSLRARIGAIRDEEVRTGTTVARRRARDAARRCRHRRPARIFVAVHRVELVVRYRRLAPDEFRILDDLRRRKSLGEALDSAAGQTSLSTATFQSAVGEWFAAWSRQGWLTP